MIIYLTRHGKTNSNENGTLFNSNTDDPLNEEGILQSKKLGAFLSKEKMDVICSSPMKRAVETSKIIQACFLSKPQLIFDERLRELNFGIFEGKTIDEVKKEYPDIYEERRKNKFNYVIPKGESYKMVHERASSFLNQIYNDLNDKSTLIVTHGTTLKLFLRILTGFSLGEIESKTYDNTSLSKFSVSRYKGDGGFSSKILLFNSDEHLKGLQ